MSGIKVCDLPSGALLKIYADRDECYTDCYATDIAGAVSLADFVCFFYTTWLFKLERVILKYAVSRPSSDEEARRVADGTIDRFAAWTVEQRSDDQLLMCDIAQSTRSWFMVAKGEGTKGEGGGTRLYFGSAVVPRAKPASGNKKSFGIVFYALLGFHKLYSRALLATARRRLQRQDR